MKPAAPLVVDLAEAMRLTGFSSDTAFHRWVTRVRLRSMRGAKGRYARSSIEAAVSGAARSPVLLRTA